MGNKVNICCRDFRDGVRLDRYDFNVNEKHLGI